MLKSIQLTFIYVNKVILNAPKLQKVKLVFCYLTLEIVHAESVETVINDNSDYAAVEQLKNLKYLCIGRLAKSIDPALLSDLDQLKEIHLDDHNSALEFFEQKRRYGRTGLKIFLFGLLLNGPGDPAVSSGYDQLSEETFVHLAENLARLADEIPLCNQLPYTAIERVAPELAINVANRFTEIYTVTLSRPVQDIERFLDFLKNFKNIGELMFDSSSRSRICSTGYLSTAMCRC